MLVSEIFTSIQGEGISYIGRPAIFLRLHGCPHKCAFCDTKYTWMPEHDKKPCIMDYGEIITRIKSEMQKYPDVELLIVTGGEPLYGENGKALQKLLNLIMATQLQVAIETSGTELPDDEFFLNCWTAPYITVSPKPAPDGKSFLAAHPGIRPYIKELKFLMGAAKSAYMQMIRAYLERNRIPLSKYSICVQPIEYAHDHERTRQARINAVEAVKETGFNLSMQMHKVLDIP